MPTFTVRTFSCDQCGETFYVHKDKGIDEIQTEHIETHRRGKCTRCNHWRTDHRPTDERVREYLRSEQRLFCTRSMGMGDNCWCAGDDRVQRGE
jgi:DNA-directed RNA polymerase subunit RPC12/RpoP